MKQADLKLMEIDGMDHAEAIRQKATERYLLDELEPATRDEFEEHLFGCQDCALDVRAGATFIERSKIIFAEENVATVPVRVPVRAAAARPGWMSWFHPAWAVPALAILLVAVVFQTISNRHLEMAANTPQVLPFAAVNVGTRGPSDTEIAAQPAQSFQLLLNIPPNSRYVSYKLDLYSAQGQLEWSRTIPGDSSDDTRSLYIPGASRSSGDLTLSVQGITAANESVNLGRYPIKFASTTQK